MFTRSLLALVCATAIAAALLALRQQRLTLMHDMARLREQMDTSRRATWDMQVRIAGKMDPPRLAKAIERAKLKLEPSTPGVVPTNAQLSAAHPNHLTDD